jgi:hypothetical protein
MNPYKKSPRLRRGLFCGPVAGANTCSSLISKPYTGAKSSVDLQVLLSTSTNPVLASLSPEMKASLVANMLFVNGEPRGFLGEDTNIRNLYASNAVAVLSAILGMRVLVYDSAHRPIVIEISTAEFLRKYVTSPINGSFRTVAEWCSNCCWPPNWEPGKCCQEVGCEGCRDSFTELTATGDLFNVR